MSAPPAFWGPLFPDYGEAGPCFFGPAFPDCSADPTTATPAGPATVGTFVLDWTSIKLRYSWHADVFKAQTGVERRAQPDDLPEMTMSGTAQVSLLDALTTRGVFARYAASGKPFLVGLPFEALPATFAGAVASVPTTTLSDWINPGQRVIARSSDRTQVVVCVVQDSTANTIILDLAPGFVLGEILPAMAFYLDAQQSFQRYQAVGSLETWGLSGRQYQFGYESQPSKAAFVDLSGYTAGALHGAVVVFRTLGTIGNGASLALVGDSALIPGSLTNVGNAYTFHFFPGSTNVGDLITALATSNIMLTGSIPAVGLFGGDAFAAATLAGGFDKTWGTMGNGAAVVSYAGSPVYDREVPPGSDSIHSMTELLDLGGVPQQFQTATVPDWGRALSRRRMGADHWQWFKAFLFATRGRQVAFWLPTWRADLTPVSLIPGTLKVSSSVGDFFAWYPALRTQVQIRKPDQTVLYAQITAQVDNGDGTRSLTVTCSDAAYSAGGGGAMVVPDLVCWLDYCRWESDDFEIAWDEGMQFAFSGQARAVQR